MLASQVVCSTVLSCLAFETFDVSVTTGISSNVFLRFTDGIGSIRAHAAAGLAIRIVGKGAASACSAWLIDGWILDSILSKRTGMARQI